MSDSTELKEPPQAATRPERPDWSSYDVRERLVEGLRLELIGPDENSDDNWQQEELAAYDRPTKRYLAGFLVPADSKPEDRTDGDSEDELATSIEAGARGGSDDNDAPEPIARRALLPSSFGVSVLVAPGVHQLEADVFWGEYESVEVKVQKDDHERTRELWRRKQRHEKVLVALDRRQPVFAGQSRLEVSAVVRNVAHAKELGYVEGVRAVTVFLTNRWSDDPTASQSLDAHTAFQTRLVLRCMAGDGFVPRRDPRTRSSDEDEELNDLHYRDVVEFAVGHGVATDAAVAFVDAPGQTRIARCRKVSSTWTPRQVVARVEARRFDDSGAHVELEMAKLANVESPQAMAAALDGLAERYVSWIANQVPGATHTRLGTAQRQKVAERLLDGCRKAADRITAGIGLLSNDADALAAFKLANQAMAMARAQRDRIEKKTKPAAAAWRPFQLAFVLMNLPGLVDPDNDDRQAVDLLFFPTGGGKTEAYLGLAAFAMVHRRLQNPGLTGCGVSVFMRYTLRLLTLDQLGRAAQVVCALELLRQDKALHGRLGEWPFEIGLWVGSAATPNVLGSRDNNGEFTAWKRIKNWQSDPRENDCPVPLQSCPWCGTELSPARGDQGSFHFAPTDAYPSHLALVCANLDCKFSGVDKVLPIIVVDDTIYRRLPAFLIATADKIASLPWRAPTGKLFGHVVGVKRNSNETPRGKEASFVGYGDEAQVASEKLALPGPDLIIQDELHLISGPLGTLAGLYEVAVDALCERRVGDTVRRPKIIASTATVRRASKQISALFGRTQVEVFPPPGPDREDSFFAVEVDASDPQTHGGRLYVGVVAPGKSSKVLLLRNYQALLARGRWAHKKLGGDRPDNPADPYMTLVGYFNALRELGGSRRIVEDEVTSNLRKFFLRKPYNVHESPFSDRYLTEPVELTSREDAPSIAKAKARLDRRWREQSGEDKGPPPVDVALATNMISVGLDIIRLGLMAVLHQPKSTAEYIQATSRVGRDPTRPGLIVTMLNLQRARDRSHFERFCTFHQSFYRGVEATSVTPFAPRALDRGLAAVVVAMARHLERQLTPPGAAKREPGYHEFVKALADRIAERAALQAADGEEDALRTVVRARVIHLADLWRARVPEAGTFPYDGVEAGTGTRPEQLLFAPLEPLLRKVPQGDPRNEFVVPWSLRNVEWTMALAVKRDAVQMEEP